MNLRWSWCAFSELDTGTLYALLRARQQVFVVEQACAYLDIDDRDAIGHHLLGWDMHPDGPRLAAYLRALPKGGRFAEASVGRIIIMADYRGQGLGHTLVGLGIEKTLQTYGVQPLRISAQSHLQLFYGKHGFVGVGAEYREDGIPHREMVRA